MNEELPNANFLPSPQETPYRTRGKGIEVEPGVWSGCSAHETGATDCPACSPPSPAATVDGELLSAFKEYVRCFGPAHVNDCPEDDTCNCQFKPMNDRVNAAIARADYATGKGECIDNPSLFETQNLIRLSHEVYLEIHEDIHTEEMRELLHEFGQALALVPYAPSTQISRDDFNLAL